MENKDWKSKVKSYSENIVFGSNLRTFYDEKREIVHCENASIDREELLKTIKRLGNNDLIKEAPKPVKRRFPKNKKEKDEIKKAKASFKKQNSGK